MRDGTTGLKMAGAMVLGVIGLSGCATKGYVNEKVAGVQSQLTTTDGQVQAHASALQAHDARLSVLDKTSNEALQRAEAAGKLAEGKFVYAMVLSDDSVKFPSDKARLSDEAEKRLSEFADKLKAENKNVYVEIQGHTDNFGNTEGNTRLGEERAETVRRYLNKEGVALNRMATISYGETAPVASNKTGAGRAKNRRVVLIVLS